MNNTTQTATNTSPVASVLGIVFVTLKLCHVIDWSWWWVTAPFWAPCVLLLGFAGAIASVWLLSLVVTTLALFFRKRK